MAVRTFADSSEAVVTSETRWSSASQRAAAIAHVLSTRCGLSAESIEVATSLLANPPHKSRIELTRWILLPPPKPLRAGDPATSQPDCGRSRQEAHHFVAAHPLCGGGAPSVESVSGESPLTLSRRSS